MRYSWKHGSSNYDYCTSTPLLAHPCCKTTHPCESKVIWNIRCSRPAENWYVRQEIFTSMSNIKSPIYKAFLPLAGMQLKYMTTTMVNTQTTWTMFLRRTTSFLKNTEKPMIFDSHAFPELNFDIQMRVQVGQSYHAVLCDLSTQVRCFTSISRYRTRFALRSEKVE